MIKLEGCSGSEAAQLLPTKAIRNPWESCAFTLETWQGEWGRETAGEGVGVYVYLGLLVGAWVGCELKSIRTVLKCLKFTSDVPKHFEL